MSDIHNHITELTRTHIVQTPYTTYDNGELRTAYHYTNAPALLTQLQHATPSSATDARSSTGYGSRPAARLEALDTLLNIDRRAAEWVRKLGHDDPGYTARCVTLVGALYPSAPQQLRPRIEADVRSWWTQARITTGYDSPAWRPDNTCPLCEAKGTLRVKLATHNAMCCGCFETWTGETLGLLADHIRLENAEDDDQPLDADGDAA